MPKTRLDQALVTQGFAPNVDRAKRMIMAGEVLVDHTPVNKSGALIARDAHIRLRNQKGRYASRAGLKLEAALDHFGLSPKSRIALDLGASTGGFTDCLLKRGAKRVYAVDVGTNQLIYRLRTDQRVISLEKTHANRLNAELIPEPVEALTVDVSFTSLSYVLPFTFPLLAKDAWLICLFKPQFEVEKRMVGEGGIVRDETAVQNQLKQFQTWTLDQGLKLLGNPFPCPVAGREGNREILLSFKRA